MHLRMKQCELGVAVLRASSRLVAADSVQYMEYCAAHSVNQRRAPLTLSANAASTIESKERCALMMMASQLTCFSHTPMMTLCCVM